MAGDRFAAAAAVLRRSACHRVVTGVTAAVRAAAPRSAAGRACQTLMNPWVAGSPETRVRQAGIAAAVALLAHDLLTRAMPAMLRPGLPAATRLALAATGLATAALAPAVVRAWPTSALRRAFAAVGGV